MKSLVHNFSAVVKNQLLENLAEDHSDTPIAKQREVRFNIQLEECSVKLPQVGQKDVIGKSAIKEKTLRKKQSEPDISKASYDESKSIARRPQMAKSLLGPLSIQPLKKFISSGDLESPITPRDNPGDTPRPKHTPEPRRISVTPNNGRIKREERLSTASKASLLDGIKLADEGSYTPLFN